MMIRLGHVLAGIIGAVSVSACVSAPTAPTEFDAEGLGWQTLHPAGDTSALPAPYGSLSARAFDQAEQAATGESHFRTSADTDTLAEIFAASRGAAAPFGAFDIGEAMFLFTRCDAPECNRHLSAVVSDANGQARGAALIELQQRLLLSSSQDNRGEYCNAHTHWIEPAGDSIPASARQALEVWVAANEASFGCDARRERLERITGHPVD